MADRFKVHIVPHQQRLHQLGAWPNGKALDYESRDCRFDPCRAHLLLPGPDKSGMLRFVT
jgi:hypothetical protein